MKKIIMVVILSLVVIFCSCTVHKQGTDMSKNESSANDNLSGFVSAENHESLDNHTSNAENSTGDTLRLGVPVVQSGIKNISFDDERAFSYVVDAGVSRTAEMAYYSRFGNNIYCSNDSFGTTKITDGVETAFFPDAYNVYEHNGVVYGMIDAESDSDHGDRFYSRLNEDGTHEKIFSCGNVFYFNDKVYFYKRESENSKSIRIYSADLNGSNKTVVSDEISSWPGIEFVFEYDGYLLYKAGYLDGVVSATPDGRFVSILSYSEFLNIEFVNNGYLYYTSRETVNRPLLLGGDFERYSLWRIDINGANRECLITASLPCDTQNVFETACFAGKLILFMQEQVYVYESDFSEPEVYDYGGYKCFDIRQIVVTNEDIAITWPNGSLSVHDTNGNVIYKREN